jgi:hypothetical protein
MRGPNCRAQLLQRKASRIDDDRGDPGALHPTEVRGARERLCVRADLDSPKCGLLGAGRAGSDSCLRNSRPHRDEQDRGERAKRAQTP